MPTGDYCASISNGLIISSDLLPGDNEDLTRDHADPISSWESAWIDLGGEG